MLNDRQYIQNAKFFNEPWKENVYWNAIWFYYSTTLEFLTDLKHHLDIKFGVAMGTEIITYVLYADDMILCSDSAAGLPNINW